MEGIMRVQNEFGIKMSQHSGLGTDPWLLFRLTYCPIIGMNYEIEAPY
jgi:hypothetical protein